MSLDTANVIATLRGLTAKFDGAVKAATPFYPQICTVVPSKGADEQYGWLGSMPGMREWLGDRIFNELIGAKYTLVNKEFENSVRIPRTTIEDDRMSMFGPVLEALGVEATYHPDELLFSLIIAASSTVGWDGQYYFDTDHSAGDSGTQSNALTYNAADHTAVTATEFKAAFNAAVLAMAQYKNDKGKLLNRPTFKGFTNLLCVVPPALLEAATNAFEAQIISNTSNVVIWKPTVIMSPHLASSVKFQVYNLGDVLKPYIFQARRPLQRQMKGLEDREFKDVKFMCDARYNVGYGAWWTAVETTFN